MPDQQIPVTQWLHTLGGLVRMTSANAETTRAFFGYARPLSLEFPPAAFTEVSCLHVAKGCKFVPSFGEVCSLLRAWWRENPAAGGSSLLTRARREGWTDSDFLWLRYWQKRKAEGFAPMAGQKIPFYPGASHQGRAHVASLIRAQSPRAWAAITAGDDE